MDGILGYYNNYTTSAAIEAVNGLLQLARRRARGYRTCRNLQAMAYWIAGGPTVETRPTLPTKNSAAPVKVYRTGDGEELLAKYRIPRSDGSGSSQTSQDVFLPAGESVRAEIISGEKTTASPVFTP